MWSEFCGHPCGHRGCCYTSWLGAANEKVVVGEELHAELRQLCRLSGTGFTGDDDHLVVLQQIKKGFPIGNDRQVWRVVKLHLKSCSTGKNML